MQHPSLRFPQRTGFTMPEMLVIIGLIVVLMAILFPALSAVRSQAQMAGSMNNMRQIGTFLRTYAGDHRETIVPSQFDYSEAPTPGRVRSVITSGYPESEVGVPHQGTWADILWTVNELGRYPGVDGELGHMYRYTSPDRPLYETLGTLDENPLRAVASNRANYFDPSTCDTGTGPKPYGTGAREAGLPGYFAANDFFNARPDAPDGQGGWYTTGQIRFPDRSMYLVDSFAGAVINPFLTNSAGQVAAFDNETVVCGNDHRGIEVDFRYNGAALMLFLDGSVRPQQPWRTLCDLQHYADGPCDTSVPSRGIRVRNLTER